MLIKHNNINKEGVKKIIILNTVGNKNNNINK